MLMRPAQKSSRPCISCRHASAAPKDGRARHPDKRLLNRMLMKRLVVACATLILVGGVCAISVGWLLAHPIQTRIGNPPPDLNAQAVRFASDSRATVHGSWSRFRNDQYAVLVPPGL